MDFDAVDFDAVVLAGGGGRRMNGVDKASLVLGGTTLLERVLAAVAGAGRVVIVGPEREVTGPVSWAREAPPGGGPLAALVAGVAELTATAGERSAPIMVLATDLPGIGAADVDRLLRALGDGPDAAIFVDDGGRLQPLVAAYRRGPLVRALAAEGSGRGRPMRALLDALDVVPVPDHGAAADCDTPEDLLRHRERHELGVRHG